MERMLYYENTMYNGVQKQFVNNVKTTSGVIAKEIANFGNNLRIDPPDQLTINKVEIFRIRNDINLVNVLKAP